MQTPSEQEDVRIAFKVSPELKKRLTDQLEWGQLRPLYTAITQDLVKLMEDHGSSLVVAAITSKSVTLNDIINSTEIKNSREDATK